MLESVILERIARNLWLTITLILPGLATYGAWRLVLLLEPDAYLAGGLKQLDSSLFLQMCVVLALAVLQQSIGIAIEAFLAVLASNVKSRAPRFNALFCRRFELAAAGKFDETGTRIVGNVFLSMNVTVGLALLLSFSLLYQHEPWPSPAPIALSVLLLAGLVTTVFRVINAESVVWAAVCKSDAETTEPERGAGVASAPAGT